MPVELLNALPAAGKTETCIQHIRELQAAEPLARVVVVVPDQSNAAYFRQRLAAAGGGMGVRVGTFREVYLELLEKMASMFR